ncbi:type VI secretion system-associated FHA domain protein TagH [Rhizobium sp. P32RR-XVIII]|uniref:type VI secretion system-associated FHA domain protein TagH n=1 Tax=Rhizobium sp. P32RR-XVIII TaxID=2726738 RepID=UPI00197FDE5B|nr:type VI secretion system-associated FHA domain protein TagH [Rhizobium sp. P32RR-XVIII]
MSILRCPDGVPPETRQVSGGEFTIGRGTECNWVLPDPQRVLSKRHCAVAFDGKVWRVIDTSTNGTFLNQETDRLNVDAPRVLRDGDRLVFGAYEIEAALDRQPSEPIRERPVPDGSPGELTGDRLTRDPFPRMGLDPLAVTLKSDDLSLNAGPDGWSVDKFIGSPQAISDNVPVIQENFRAPRTSFELLPEDWDAERANDTVPESSQPALPVAAKPGAPPEISVPSIVSAQAAQVVGVADQGGALMDALAAFIAGAGLQGTTQGEPIELLRGMGEAFRAMVTGLRRMMMARAAIKGEFRIEQTVIRPVGNNPLKFSASDEDALAALLGIGGRRDMTAKDAVADALRDMRLHELAMSSAMQQAVQHLVAELDPARVKRGIERETLDIMPGRYKARSWDAYEALHGSILQALADDFDSAFGKSFARAYEQAMSEIAGQLDE